MEGENGERKRKNEEIKRWKNSQPKNKQASKDRKNTKKGNVRQEGKEMRDVKKRH